MKRNIHISIVSGRGWLFKIKKAHNFAYLTGFAAVLSLLLLDTIKLSGQVVIAQQDFEATPATPTLTFTNTNGGNSTGTNGSGGLPANANLFVSGSRGWQAINTTSTLIFANQSLSGYSNTKITFRLSGMSVNSTNGIDGADIVTVSVSVDGGITYSNELTIAGSTSNQRWDFTATGNTSVTYDGNNTPTAVTSSSGAGGISLVTINIPNGTPQVRLRVSMLNNDTNERWVIDDVVIEGCLNPTITLGTNPSVCQGTTSANLSYSATTNSPNQYSIDYDATANTAGFVDVTNATLPASPIVLTVPGAAAATTYNATLTVKNSTTGCVSTTYNVAVTVNPSTLTATTTVTNATCANGADGAVNLTVAPTLTIDGIMNEAAWGTALATSTGGPAPGFGTGHEINALYSIIGTDNLFFGLAGNVQSGNRILLFLDTKTGGYSDGNFGRTGAPEGIDQFNSLTTFDAGFLPDYCLVIGTNGSGNYFFDLFTLAGTAGGGGGSNTFLGDNSSPNLEGNPLNSDLTRGFEAIISKAALGYTGGAIQMMAMYISDGGFLSNQFLTRANSGDGNYGSGAVNFGAAAPNPVTLNGLTYNWSNSATTEDISSLVPGTYSVTVTPAFGCSASATATVGSTNPTPTATAPSNQMYCAGQSTTAIPLSGTPVGVVFDISGGAAIGLADQTNVTQVPAFTAVAGSATISITPKANGCTGTPVTYTVTVNALPNAGTISGTTAICDNGSSQLMSNSPITNGTWSSSNTLVANVSGSGLVSAVGGGTAIISYTVTDANNCTNTATTTLTVVNSPTTANAGSAQTICSGGVVGLSANTPAFGTGAWSVVSGPSTSSSQFSNTASPTAVFTPASGGGTYTLAWTISNAPCTPSVGNVVITVNNCPCQTSVASATAYDSPTFWDSGDNDGTGFGAWTLTNTNSGNSSQNGHFIGNAAGNGDGNGGSINTGGESWGLYANNFQTASAVRPFVAPLQPGSTFSVKMDNGYIGNTGNPLPAVGMGLRTSGGTNLTEFFFRGGGSHYILSDAAGETVTSIPFTDDGLMLTFTIISATTYNLVINSFGSGTPSQTFTNRTFSTSGAAAQVRLFNYNANSDNMNGGQDDAFFNSLQICSGCSPFTAQLNGAGTICPGTSTNLTATITDGTSPYSLTYSDGVTSTTVNSYTTGSNISVSPAATTTYSITSILDANGCAGSIVGTNQTVTVQDITNPAVATCPSNIMVNTNDDGGTDCNVTVTYAAPTFNDNCDGMGLAATSTSGPASGASLPASGSPYTVTHTYDDIAAGNTPAVCTFTITVTDNNNPTLICPGNPAINTSSNGTGDCTGSYTIADPVSDNCLTGLTWGYSASGATTIAAVTGIADGMGSGAINFNKGTTTVALTGKDAANNVATTCSFDIVVTDDEAPTLACPTSPVNLNTGAGGCTAAYTIADPLTENCAGGTWSYSTMGTTTLAASGIADGTGSGSLTFNVGTTVVTLTGNDANPLSAASCSFNVVVADNQLPNALCKSAVVVLDGSGNGTLLAADVNNNSTDNCGIQSISVSPNAFNCSQVVPVPNPPVWVNETHYDNSSTDVNEFIELAGIAATNLADYSIVRYNSSGVIYGTNALTGTIPNQSNGFGTSALTFPTNGLQNGAGSGFALINTATNTVVQLLSYGGTFTATGGLASGMTSTNLPVSESGSLAGGSIRLTGTGTTYSNFSWQPEAAPASPGAVNAGQTFLSTTTPVTLTITDVNGLMNTCIANVTVTDNTPPTVTCPTNATINTSTDVAGDCAGAYTITDPVSDNCATGLTWGYAVSGATTIAAVTGVADGNNSPALALTKGVNTITLTGKDKAGNNAVTCSFTVTVADDELPTLTCPPTQNLSAGANCTATYTIADPLMDNCTGATWSYAATGATTIAMTTRNDGQSSGSLTFNGGTTTVTLNATDAAGNNATSCSFSVVIADNQNPTAVCVTTTVMVNLGSNGTATIDPAAINNGSTDNCTIQSLSVSPATVNCSNLVMTFGTDLIISEYVESGADKYLEIYNPTASSINLSNYELRLYSNGASSPTTTSPLTGTLASGSVIVYRNSGSANIAGAISLSAINFNGDDAIVLYKTSSSQDIDIFGKYGNDPGTAWTGAGGYSTSSKTLRRKSSVIQGVTVNPPGTGPSAFTTLTTEWDLFADGTVSGLGTHTGFGTQVTLTVTDGANNTATCIANVMVQDQIAPTLTCSNQTVTTTSNGTGDCTGSFTINDPLSDNCTATWGYSASGATTIAAVTGIADGTNSSSLSLQKGVTNFTLTALDASGNVATNCAFSVTVNDDELPVLTCPGTVSLNTASGLCTQTYTIADPIADNCTGAAWGYSASGATTIAAVTGIADGTGSSVLTFNKGTTAVTLTGVDAAGNPAVSCTFDITVIDNQAPTLACPSANQTISVNANTCQITIPDYVAALTPTDNCPGVITEAQTVAAGAYGPVVNGEVVTVTYTATDVAGKTAYCTMSITVSAPEIDMRGNNVSIADGDNTPDLADHTNFGGTLIGVPLTRTFTIVNTGTQPLTISSISSDNVNFIVGALTPSSPVPAGGSATFLVTFTAPGPANTLHTATLTVLSNDCSEAIYDFQVNAAVGCVGATIVCPASVTVNTLPNTCSAPATYTPNLGGNPIQTVTYTFTGATAGGGTGNGSGSTFNLGVTTVTLTHTNVCGSQTCSFSVSVLDVQPPVIACPASVVQSTAPNQCTAALSYAPVSVSDNCGAPVLSYAFTGALSSSGTGTGSGTSFPMGTTVVTLKATDGAGLMATCSFSVTINDTQLPVITCPGNVTLNMTAGQCGAIVNYPTPIASDNCGAVTLTLLTPASTASGSLFPAGTTTVTWQAADQALPVSNTQTCSFTVTVYDLQAPAVTCPANVTTYSTATSCQVPVTYTATASDNCNVPPPVVSYTFSGATVGSGAGTGSGTSFNRGITTITLKATDNGGLTRTCTFRVIVIDLIKPVLTCVNPAPVGTTPGTCSAVVNYTAPTFTDNCPPSPGTATRIQGLASGSTFPLGNSTIVFRATDANGNSTTCIMTIQVVDNQPPVITCPPSVTVAATGTPCNATVPYPPVTASDNCGSILSVFLVSGLMPNSVFPAGTTVNTWRATDNAGLTAQCSFSVTVVCSAQKPAPAGVGTAEKSSPALTLALSLAPNPATQQVTFAVTGLAEQEADLLVMDALGRIVARQVVASGQENGTLEVSNWPQGLYQVLVRTEKVVVTKMLSVQRN
jgi:hypothetical protein